MLILDVVGEAVALKRRSIVTRFGRGSKRLFLNRPLSLSVALSPKKTRFSINFGRFSLGF
jgi:hypothetical protein